MAKAKSRSAGTSIVRVPQSAPMVVVAKSPRRRRAAAVVRRVGRAARRGASAAAGAAARRDQEVSAVVGAVALGIAEGANEAGEPRLEIPTVGGIDPAVVWGAVLTLAPHFLGSMGRSKTMRRLSAAGVGVLCVGVSRSAKRGSVKVAGDDDY